MWHDIRTRMKGEYGREFCMSQTYSSTKRTDGPQKRSSVSSCRYWKSRGWSEMPMKFAYRWLMSWQIEWINKMNIVLESNEIPLSMENFLLNRPDVVWQLMLYKDLRHVLLWEERRKTKLALWVHSLCNHLSIEDHIEIYVLLDLFLSVAKVLLSCSEIHGAEVYMPNPFEDKNPIKFSKKKKLKFTIFL